MCGIEIPRQQVFDPVDGMVGDASHHFPQMGFGIQTVEFRRTDQAVDRCGTFSSGIRSCEQAVLPAQGALTILDSRKLLYGGFRQLITRTSLKVTRLWGSRTH